MDLMRYLREDVEYISEASPAQLEAALREYTEIARPGQTSERRGLRTKPFRGVVEGERIEISVIPEGRNSFTPHLVAHIEPYGDRGSRLVGVAGPHQLVIFFLIAWVLFAASMSALVILLTLLNGELGAANAPMLLLAPLFVVVAPAVLLREGKSIGAKHLHHGMQDVLSYAEFLRTEAARTRRAGEVELDLEGAEAAAQVTQAAQQAKRR